MNKHYLGQLQIEANVPDQLLANEFINVTLDFKILCPKCGPKTKKIKKNGHDTKLKGNPQVFYCHTCHIHFFAHTSWIFKQFSNLVIDDVIKHLYIDNLSPKSVSKLDGVSQSMISKLRHHCQGLIEAKISIIRSELKEIKKLSNLPLVRQSAIWWDETFFLINGEIYSLILIIDATGKVMTYNFSKNRKTGDYLSILYPIIDKLPEIPVFIGDGWQVYENVCRELKRDCFLIQHIHSHPWENARIHQFKYDEKLHQIEQISIQIPYDSFVKEEQVTGVSGKRIITLKQKKTSAGKRGRPKGSKDREKRRKRQKKVEIKVKKELKKRGRKNLKDDGATFTFCPFPFPDGWKVEFISQVSKSSNMKRPSLKEIDMLLSLTYEIMNGGYIQSNLIESKNNVIKSLIKGKGLKNKDQYETLLRHHLLSKGELYNDIDEPDGVEMKFRNSLGFKNVLHFFRPCSERIEIL